MADSQFKKLKIYGRGVRLATGNLKTFKQAGSNYSTLGDVVELHIQAGGRLKMYLLEVNRLPNAAKREVWT